MRESADKRSRRTQRIIQTTMLELLCTQPMTSIKIVDLCTQADINRTTFYLHFSSIADVLASLQDEIIRHIFAESEALVDFTKPSDPLPFLNACTGVLGSYKHLGSFLRHGQAAWNRKYGQAIRRDYSKLRCGECVFSDHMQLDLLVSLPDGSTCLWSAPSDLYR